MSNGDGHKEEKQRKRRCPFLNEWCIDDTCALHTQVIKAPHKIELCAFDAILMILSEINQKTQPSPPQKINLPFIHRG